MMRRGFLFLLAGVTLFCLAIFLLSLLATTVSEVPSAAAGADVRQVAEEALAPLAEYGSQPLTTLADEDGGDTDERPVSASVLTMLVVACALFGVSLLWLATTGALRRGAIRSSRDAGGDRRWSAGAHDGLSFLGVFLL